jgi:hypothetical protein
VNALALVSGIVVALLPFVALYRLVAREERKIAETASDEMWERDLEWWMHHNEKPAAVDAATGRESSRSGLRPVRQENVTRAAQG